MKSLNFSWTESHAKYWDAISQSYDTLYSGKWSLLENSQTLKQLDKIILQYSCPKILDIGCGTGLGYNFCRDLTSDSFYYVGVDISPEMIEICKSKWSSVPFFVGDMEDLSRFSEGDFDIVICLFSTFSYAMSYKKTIHELHRIIKPGGYIFISMLSKFSLRRLFRLKYGSVERYSTRCSSSHLTVSANVYSIADIVDMFQNVGFSKPNIQGQGIFSGLIEAPCLWGIDKYLSIRMPAFCHIVNVDARKNYEE